MKTGVMICGHGSRSQSAVDEFRVLAEKLPAYLPDDWMTDYGYLEFANPVLRDGLDKLREAGCERILAVPGMLFAAMHSKNDIPTVLNTYAKKHGIDVRYGRELGVDPKMIAAAGARTEMPGCSLCMGNQARVAPGCTVVSTSTRNFPNRLGQGANVFLASAELAAVAAILGKLPTKDEYMAFAQKLDPMAGDVYRYLNFNELDEFTEAAALATV